jgi:hypothetical protein
VDAYRRFAARCSSNGSTPKGLLYVSTAHEEADIERTREAMGSLHGAVAGISTR